MKPATVMVFLLVVAALAGAVGWFIAHKGCGGRQLEIIVSEQSLPDGVDSADDNAALWYWGAMAQVGVLYPHDHPVGQQLDDYLTEPSLDIPEALCAAVESNTTLWEELDLASRKPFCRFAIDRENALALTLPHGLSFRRCAALLCVEAALALKSSNGETASQRLATCYRMADHLGEDQQWVSSRIASHIIRAADRMTKIGLERGLFDSEDKSRFCRALETIETDDALGYVSAVRREYEINVPWVCRRYSGDNGAAEFQADFGVCHVQGVLGMPRAITPDEFRSSLNRYVDLMRQIAETFANPDEDVASIRIHDLCNLDPSDARDCVASTLLLPYGRLFDELRDSRRCLRDLADRLQSGSKAQSDGDPSVESASTTDPLP